MDATIKTTHAVLSLFRKMSVIEAEKTLATSSVQPAIKGAHPIKHFSTSLEKARTFHNRVVTGTESIIEFQLDVSRFEELIKDAVLQKGASRFPDKIQINTEGLTVEEIVAGQINVGIPPKLLNLFSKAVLSVKEVK